MKIRWVACGTRLGIGLHQLHRARGRPRRTDGRARRRWRHTARASDSLTSTRARMAARSCERQRRSMIGIWLNSGDLRLGGQLLGKLGDVHRVVAHPLELDRRVVQGQQLAQVAGHGLLGGQRDEDLRCSPGAGGRSPRRRPSARDRRAPESRSATARPARSRAASTRAPRRSTSSLIARSSASRVARVRPARSVARPSQSSGRGASTSALVRRGRLARLAHPNRPVMYCSVSSFCGRVNSCSVGAVSTR